MASCDLCKNEKILESGPCKICGYILQTESIDRNLMEAYYHKINKNDWPQSVLFLYRLQNLMHMSQADLTRFFNVSKAKISDDLKLARALKEDPDLSKIKSKKKALESIYSLAPRKINLEDDLQKYIYNHWQETPFSEKWDLVKSKTSYVGKHSAGTIGEMDLLARNKEKNQWLVIELKRDQSSDETVGQILRYMGYINNDEAEKDDQVYGAIICHDFDEKINSALSCVPFITKWIYRLIGGKPKIMTLQEAKKYDACPEQRALNILETLPDGIREKVLENYLKNQS